MVEYNSESDSQESEVQGQLPAEGAGCPTCSCVGVGEGLHATSCRYWTEAVVARADQAVQEPVVQTQFPTARVEQALLVVSLIDLTA